jgi:hypothetical protein
MLDWLRELTASGALLDFALAVLVLEVLILLKLRRSRTPAPSARSLIANAGSGGSLILTARLALADAPPEALMGALLMALAFHSWDQWQRW